MSLISLDRFQAIVDRLDSNHLDGVTMSHGVVAKEVGVNVSTVTRIADGIHVHQVGRQKPQKHGNPLAASSPRRVLKGNAVYLPTTEQIETECALLRAVRITSEDDYDGWMPQKYSYRLQPVSL